MQALKIRKLTTHIHQSYFLVALCLGIISGTILGLVFRINFFSSPIWLALVATLFIFTYFQPKLVFITLALTAGFLLAFFRITSDLQAENYIKNLYDKTITVTGTVSGDPNGDESNLKLKLDNLRFGENSDSGEVASSGSLYVQLKSTAETGQIARSDNLTLTGKLLQGFGTYSGFLYQPKLQKISRPTPGDPVLNLRNWFADRVKSGIEEKESSLGLSYLLGMKTNLDKDLDENLRTVGLVHIVVASGAHLSILVEVTRKIFSKISRFSSLLFSSLFIILFMSMIGFTPSILRAGLMSLLTIAAGHTGRKIAPWRLILTIAAITLLINPMYIIDLGWLLSFASYAGIMILGARLTKFFYGQKKPKFIASTLLTTLSATMMTLPITLYYFGQISLISIIANLLILPTLSLAMGLTFLTGLLADLPFLNTATSFLATKLLDFHIFVVNTFATQKSFLIKIDPYEPKLFLIYIIIFLPLAVGLIRHKMVKLKQEKYQLMGENYVRTQ